MFEAEEVEGAEDSGEAEVVVVAFAEVVGGALGKVIGAGDCGGIIHWGLFIVHLAGKAVEVEHEVEGVKEVLFVCGGVAEGLDGLGAEGGGFGVDGARGVQGEEPLDEVVMVFEVVEGEGPEVVEIAAGVVGGLVEVKSKKGHFARLV